MGVLRFAILGLGAGAIYGFTASGIVLVYRASGVLNFAHGALGMVGAFIFYVLRDNGMPTPLALLIGLTFGATVGALTHLLVMRPLRSAPAISRLIAALGLLTVLLAIGQRVWGDRPRIVSKLLPAGPVEVLPDIRVGQDRLILLAVGVATAVGLTLFYRWTRFGLATVAVAENRRSIAAQGVSPDLVATVNWAMGGVLAVTGAILIVNITGLQVQSLTLLVIPALAAALVGGFRSFGLTLAGGLMVGILESEVAYLQTRLGPSASLAGWSRSIPFLVIIAVLVIRGRALPLRGEVIERPAELGTGRISWPTVVVVAAGALAVIAVAPVSWVQAITSTASVALIVLSLVVVTGYTGQLSLAQYALAGMGAWVAARLVANYDVPFGIAALAGIAAALPIGVLVGLPALRTRGVNLAVATLGLALLLESQILANADRTGGITGTRVGVPSLFGIELDAVSHPERYAVLAVVAFTIAALAIANLRRGQVGRRLVAVRTNERAAASLGISVFGAKLYAFALGSAIAAAGGILIAFRNPVVIFYPTFGVFESIYAVVYSVVGGLGYVIGALIGAINAPGTLGFKFATLLGDEFESWFRLLGGLLLIAILLQDPNGIVSLNAKQLKALRAKLGRSGARTHAARLETADVVSPVEPKTLELRDVTVRFGGVVALDSVSLTINPGEVVGLIGANGAGKTTLIDVSTGFVTCAAGEILLDGEPITDRSARERAVAGLGRSFQSLELFESMTVEENLRTASDPRGAWAYVTDLVLPRNRPLPPAAAAAVKEFGLEDDLQRRPDELPYGRRRLVVIARAVAANPSILFLDEPAAGLDVHERAELGRLVRRLATQLKLGVLLIEHDVALVLDTCDRIAVLEFGRTIAEGTPQQIKSDPAVVQSYLGRAATSPAATSRVAPSVSDEPLLRVRGLSAGYGERPVVHDLDLEVRPGEVVALLGANGAGKTTTLLSIVGELPPLGGTVECLGATKHEPLHRRAARGLAFVPEERSVFMSLSTATNLRLGRGRMEDALARFPELEQRQRVRAGLLSGGEQQMLTLSRALAGSPRLLVADELSLGLAPIIVQRLLDAIRAAADEGVGVLLVEQHVQQALAVADRAYVLHRGRVVMGGAAADVLDQIDEVENAYLTGVPIDAARPA